MAQKKSKGTYMEFYGTEELMNKLANLGGNVEEVVAKALQAGAQIPYNEMKEFASQHVDTGDMLRSLEITEPEIKNGKVKIKVGFNIKKGGLPALFLNYGTPTHSGRNGHGKITGITPSFFIDKAFENNVDKIKELQLEAINNAIKESE